jgi:hypothetical protein
MRPFVCLVLAAVFAASALAIPLLIVPALAWLVLGAAALGYEDGLDDGEDTILDERHE